MAGNKEKDKVSGRDTTGHEWDGLKELNTPLPRWWLMVFYACIAFSAVWVVLYPALPIQGATGLTGWTARGAISGEVAEHQARMEPMLARIRAATRPGRGRSRPARLRAGRRARRLRQQLPACHGAGGQGAPGLPALADDDWLWGGTLEAIQHTIRHGVRNTEDDDAAIARCRASAPTAADPAQIDDVADYVLSLSGAPPSRRRRHAARRSTPRTASPAMAIAARATARSARRACPTRSGSMAAAGRDRGADPTPRAGVMPSWEGRLDRRYGQHADRLCAFAGRRRVAGDRPDVSTSRHRTAKADAAGGDAPAEGPLYARGSRSIRSASSARSAGQVGGADLLLALYYVVPWLRWDRGPGAPDQAVLVDMPRRASSSSGSRSGRRRSISSPAALILAAFALFAVTSLFGRVWCGFTCPQTVWTDLFMWVERGIQGDRNARMKLDRGRSSGAKVAKKALTHGAWLLIAAATGGAWIMYFNDAPTVMREILTGQASSRSISSSRCSPPPPICWPAGRASRSAPTCAPGRASRRRCSTRTRWSSPIDAWRGEPRGKAKGAEGRGDCVDCAPACMSARRASTSATASNSNASAAASASMPATASWRSWTGRRG